MRPYLSHRPNISLRVPSFTRLWIISSAFRMRLSHCIYVIISFLSAGFAWYRLAFHSPLPINHFRVSSARICDCCVGVHTSVLDWYDDFASGVRFCSMLSAFDCISSCASSARLFARPCTNLPLELVNCFIILPAFSKFHSLIAFTTHCAHHFEAVQIFLPRLYSNEVRAASC